MDGFRILLKTTALVSAFVILLNNPASGFFCLQAWDWVVLENGVPTTSGPYILNPSSYNQYDPPYVFQYAHPYPNWYNWRTITFEQISGPSPEFGTTTIYRDTPGGCPPYFLQNASSALSASPPPGIYTIRATVVSNVLMGESTTSTTTGTSTIIVSGGPNPVPALSQWGALALIVSALSTGAFLLIRRPSRLSEWKRGC